MLARQVRDLANRWGSAAKASRLGRDPKKTRETRTVEASKRGPKGAAR
jgi:hypothetical protein